MLFEQSFLSFLQSRTPVTLLLGHVSLSTFSITIFLLKSYFFVMLLPNTNTIALHSKADHLSLFAPSVTLTLTG